MKVELIHPITHDGKMYGRGVHDVPEELAKIFLRYRWAAKEFHERAGAPQGVVKEERESH